jgi:hypothetical protein
MATANVTLKVTGSAGTTIDNTASVSKATPALTASASTVIGGANNPPVATDGSVTTNKNVAVSGTLTASDPDSDPLTFSIVAQPVHGTVSVTDATTGAFTYTPASGYTGDDSFTFNANDGTADSNTATESMIVKAAGGGSGGAFGPWTLLLVGLCFFARLRRHPHRS